MQVPGVESGLYNPNAMIDLLHGRTLVFETHLSTDEITARLQREVAPATWRLYENRRQLFVGTFADGRFRMMRLVRGKNSFRPLIEGRLSPSSTGARIDVRLKLHPLVLIVCAFLLIVGGLITLVSLSEVLAGGESGHTFVTAVAFTLLVLIFIAIMRAEASKATQLLADLFEAKASTK